MQEIQAVVLSELHVHHGVSRHACIHYDRCFRQQANQYTTLEATSEQFPLSFGLKMVMIMCERHQMVSWPKKELLLLRCVLMWHLSLVHDVLCVWYPTLIRLCGEQCSVSAKEETNEEANAC